LFACTRLGCLRVARIVDVAAERRVAGLLQPNEFALDLGARDLCRALRLRERNDRRRCGDCNDDGLHQHVLHGYLCIGLRHPLSISID